MDDIINSTFTCHNVATLAIFLTSWFKYLKKRIIIVNSDKGRVCVVNTGIPFLRLREVGFYVFQPFVKRKIP